jgi:glyoxylase-like metal-dependent hydrolase (beta-lactamase superfamily II)
MVFCVSSNRLPRARVDLFLHWGKPEPHGRFAMKQSGMYDGENIPAIVEPVRGFWMHPTSFRIGDMTIHRIVESGAPFMDAMEFLPDLTPEVLDEHRSWLEPAALESATGKPIFCFQSYLVRTPHDVVLIDSCVGNDKNRPTRPSWHMKTDKTYMSALASAGTTVQDIDYVMCTHLHPDHVGWNTRLENGRCQHSRTPAICSPIARSPTGRNETRKVR